MYSMKILLLNIANQLFKVNFKPSIQYHAEAIFFQKYKVLVKFYKYQQPLI